MGGFKMLGYFGLLLVRLIALPVEKTVKTVETIGGVVSNAIEYVTTTEKERDEKRRKKEYGEKCRMIEDWYFCWFVGALILVLFGFLALLAFGEGSDWTYLIVSFITFAIAIIFVSFGLKLLVSARRCKIYLPIISDRDEITLTEIAEMCDVQTCTVVGDLQKMITKGIVKGYYLDLKRNLFLKSTPTHK
jgi:hypothetical protein